MKQVPENNGDVSTTAAPINTSLVWSAFSPSHFQTLNEIVVFFILS